MIVVGSVRPVRVGLPIAEWVKARASAIDGIEVDFVDLRELDLPLMNEVELPIKRQYEQAHTIAWSERVAAADAFIFIAPEYNWSYSAALKNAVDYLSQEWRRKPVGFVGYGGVSAGTRGFAAMLPVVTFVGMVVATTNIFITTRTIQYDADGAYMADERHESALHAQLTELQQLATALKPLR
jgi:NAD(P)H-dependent FMN reductase